MMINKRLIGAHYKYAVWIEQSGSTLPVGMK